MKKILIALVLCLTMFATGCSAAWVTTLDTILAAAAPALIDILQIVAIAEGKPFNSAEAAKVNADAAAVKSLASDFANASAAAAPGICSQLSAAIATYGADQAEILKLAQVSDPAVQTKITLLSGLVAGTVEAILAVIPQCNSNAKAELAKAMVAQPPLQLDKFTSTYNGILVAKTGNAVVDAKTKSLRLPEHSKMTRVLTFGLVK